VEAIRFEGLNYLSVSLILFEGSFYLHLLPSWLAKMDGIQQSPSGVKKKFRTATNLVLHLHPSNVPEKTIRFTHTFGLGGMAALIIMVQIVTGILLRFQYEPFVDRAYASVLAMQDEHIFGTFIRNIHHWSGQFLIIITFLHLARIIFTTAYFPPRRINWLIGLGLFVGVILMNFTGYLLPWDQLSYWAVTVTSSMLDYVPLAGRFIKFQILGGNQVGQATLMNFYNFHTGVLPIMLIVLMVYHFWKVRKANGVIVPINLKSENGKLMVPTIPNLVMKELSAALILLAIIFTFSLLVNSPLQEKANSSVSPNPAKAPWYFLGIQELIVHIHPVFSVFIIPTLLLVGFVLLSYSKKEAMNKGVWFSSPSSKNTIVTTAIFTIILIPLWIIADEYFLHFYKWLPSVPLWVSEGIIPFILFVCITATAGWKILKKFKMPFNQMVMSGFVFIGTAYFIMMLTSLFFRGPGMELILPFK
jgi:quinol-cytochrome oxidoreductase complex cytochrome b subunit